MLENSTFPENSSTAAAAVAAVAAAVAVAEEESLIGGVSVSISGGVFGEEERSRESTEDGGGGGGDDRNNSGGGGGGNRWPREETLALLKVRSDMDMAFKDSGIKAPLWEEVSRKLTELGYHRSSKKCKEKFENIYKYHRRTKEGRSSRPNSKSYRFFEQLEAFDHNHPSLLAQLPPPPPPPPKQQNQNQNPNTTATPPPPSSVVPQHSQEIITTTTTTTTSSTSSSDKEEFEGGGGTRGKRKRKMADFFDRLMKDVMEKQDILQKNFIEAIERHERERIAREEAWQMQEMARIKREQDLLLQERSIAATKDAAVIAFLQKFSEEGGGAGFQLPEMFSTPSREEKMMNSNFDEKQENSNNNNINNNGGNGGGESCTSSGRWPKAEVEALIRIRTTFFDEQNQEMINGTKGPLWEEISSAMKKIGYDRSAKRCKEKWENINKYFKRVRESNKRRPEDSKTCPYFHQLEALYRVKSTKKQVGGVLDTINNNTNSSNNSDTISGGYNFKPEDLLMQMMGGHNNIEQHQEITHQISIGEEEINDNDDEDEDEEEEDDDDNYQIVANDTSSMAVMQ